MRNMCRVVGAIALSCMFSPAVHAASDPALDTVTLELRWNHQFQFAGYYAAEAKGIYREFGLDVRIRPEPHGDAGTANVISGKSEFGIGGDDLLLRRLQGEPIVALAAIFQHSAHALAVRASTNILRPEDLVGKRIMANLHRDSDIHAMLLHQHVNMDSVHFVDEPWNLEKFIHGDVDAISCYVTTQEFDLRRRGIGYRLLHPIDFGIDFYGDILYTSENLVQHRPELVEAFRRASLLGWRYAMDHQEEIIREIIAEYSTPEHPLTYESLAFEAASMQRLILPELVEIGTMSESRWQRIYEEYRQLGMATGNARLDQFIYATVRPPDLGWVRWATAIVVVTFLLAGWILYWNFMLRRQVRKRTFDLEDRNSLLAREIDMRKRVEGALRESEQRLRSLVDGLPDLVLFRSATGQWTEANLFARDLLGITAEANDPFGALSDSALLFLRREEQQQENLVTDGAVHRSEEVLIPARGSPLVMDMIRVPIRGPAGEAMGIVVIGRDMTKRKKAEAGLAEVNQTLNAILSASPIAIVAIDREKVVVQWNAAAESLFGWTAREVIGHPMPFVPQDRSYEYGSLTDRLVDGGAYVGRILQSVRKDGTRLNLFSSAASLKSAAGQTIGAVVMFVDITETLKVQDELRRSLNEKEVLLKEIHHRVKNNLQVISSLLSLQSERIRDKEAQDVFKDSQNRVRSMAMIHERLYRSQDLAHVDFGEYVRSLSISLFNSYRTALPRVTCDIAVEDMQVDVDIAVPCGLVLNELISNALKYAYPGGSAGVISVRLREVAPFMVELAIEDDGVGLPPGIDLKDGTSLGYQLVHLLVAQLGGNIEVKSDHGVHVTVTFLTTRQKPS